MWPLITKVSSFFFLKTAIINFGDTIETLSGHQYYHGGWKVYIVQFRGPILQPGRLAEYSLIVILYYCQIFARQKEIPQKTSKISADISARLFRVTCNKVSGILKHKD